MLKNAPSAIRLETARESRQFIVDNGIDQRIVPVALSQ